MDAIADWHALLRPSEELTPQFTAAFAGSMRARKLTFGARVHCPFLRPFFLTAGEEARIASAAETIAALGERIVRAAFQSDDLYEQLGMTEAEDALVDIDPGTPPRARRRASTRFFSRTRCISPSTTRSRPPASATRSGCASCSSRRR